MSLIVEGDTDMILVTGATGFVGSALIDGYVKKGVMPIASVRRKVAEMFFDGVKQVQVPNISSTTDWKDALLGVDVVVHTAARVHQMKESAEDPLSEFREMNCYATLNLAKQAAEAGVKRFVFLSSIKVNGEFTKKGEVFKPEDENIPNDPYGVSKYEAEQELLNLSKRVEMEVVIIRPPLVYGPGVKANFKSMMNWVNRGFPLPFKLVDNLRSFVAIENLVSFIMLCSDYEKTPQAANEVFLISDGEDVSLKELLEKLRVSFGRGAYLLSVPVRLMIFVSALLGKKDVAKRLFGSLQVDSSKANKLLGWHPVISMDEQLKKTVNAYLEDVNGRN